MVIVDIYSPSLGALRNEEEGSTASILEEYEIGVHKDSSSSYSLDYVARSIC